jgi:GAF domain-containing protein
MTDKKPAAGEKGEGLDLTQQREEFLETFFRKGAEFTEELLDEVNGQRSRIASLAEENASLRHQLASDDAIRDLLSKIEELEQEKRRLHDQARSATQERLDYAGRYSEVERELDAMANLYVASYQLHATLDAREVLSVIEQMLMQFVGTSSFAIYLRREESGQPLLHAVHSFQFDDLDETPIPWNTGPIGEAASTQVNYIADPSKVEEAGAPLACIPMVLDNETIGVIAIFGLLEQKKKFVDVDFELFKLLALHSASAIVGAGLLARAGGVDEGLASYQRQ